MRTVGEIVKEFEKMPKIEDVRKERIEHLDFAIGCIPELDVIIEINNIIEEGGSKFESKNNKWFINKEKECIKRWDWENDTMLTYNLKEFPQMKVVVEVYVDEYPINVWETKEGSKYYERALESFLEEVQDFIKEFFEFADKYIDSFYEKYRAYM